MLLHSLAEELVNTNCNIGLFSWALVLHGGVHLPTTLEKRQAPRGNLTGQTLAGQGAWSNSTIILLSGLKWREVYITSCHNSITRPTVGRATAQKSTTSSSVLRSGLRDYAPGYVLLLWRVFQGPNYSKFDNQFLTSHVWDPHQFFNCFLFLSWVRFHSESLSGPRMGS